MCTSTYVLNLTDILVWLTKISPSYAINFVVIPNKMLKQLTSWSKLSSQSESLKNDFWRGSNLIWPRSGSIEWSKLDWGLKIGLNMVFHKRSPIRFDIPMVPIDGLDQVHSPWPLVLESYQTYRYSQAWPMRHGFEVVPHVRPHKITSCYGPSQLVHWFRVASALKPQPSLAGFGVNTSITTKILDFCIDHPSSGAARVTMF